MQAIEVDQVVKRFGEKTAVDHLSLSVPEGEFFALLGSNGAGKTTLIRILSGLMLPSEGDARLMGHSILTEETAAKAVTNVSPQETAVAPNLTVRENLELIAGLYGMNTVSARAAASEMILEFNLGENERSRAKTLSGGWMRRLSIAMALISNPKILFLDEPTLGLDVIARRELWKHIRALKGKATVVLTTHYLEEAEALADRIGIMAKGELRAVGTAEELKQKTGKDNFEDAFVAIAMGEEGELPPTEQAI